jgi:hypothetical protein
MITFNKKYIFLSVSLFFIEILIALFLHDEIIRPYVGDFLVVILIYCFVRSFLNTPVLKTALAVLVFSFIVEISQHFNLAENLGLQHSKIAVTLLGNAFAWGDILSYSLGIILVIVVERTKLRTLTTKTLY